MILNHFWPWKELARLRDEVEFLKRTLEHEQTSHNLTRASLQDHKLELIDHRVRVAQGQKDVRKLATILAMRSGITILLLFFSLSAFGQPILRQPLTTNTLALAPSTAYFLGWDGTTIDWEIPPDGLGTNYWNTNASFIFPIPHLSSSNDLGWWNAGGDVSVNATNNDKLFGLNATNEVARMGTSITNGAILNLSNLVSTISQNATNEALLIGINGTNANTLLGQQATNNDTVVSNGVAAHTITVAGTANQITSSVGTAQTLAANPATTLSLPDPLIAPGQFSANGITNRGPGRVFFTGGFTNIDAGGAGNGDVPVVIYRTSTANNDQGSTAASNVVSFVIPANSLLTNKSVTTDVWGDLKNNSGSVTNLTLSISLGGTVVWQTTAFQPANSNSRFPWYLRLSISAINSTSLQTIDGFFFEGFGGAATTGFGPVSPNIKFAATLSSNGPASADSTTDLTVLLTATWASQSTLCEFNVKRVVAVVQ